MTHLGVELIRLVQSLQRRRYPTILVALEDEAPLGPVDIGHIVDKCVLRHVNFRDDVLTRPERNIILGAYLRGEFLQWLIGAAREAGGILVEKADEVIAAWPREDRRAFFLELLRTQCNDPNDPNKRAPIVLLSFHVARLSLPAAERGQGIVLFPSRLRGGHLDE